MKIIKGLFLALGLFLFSSIASATTTWLPIPQFFSTIGQTLAGGQVFTYAAGTTTPQPSYTDITGLVQNANPVILDSTGKPSQGIWLSNSAYKIVVQDSSGNIQWFQDNLSFGSASGSTAFSTITSGTNSNAGNFVASGNTWNFTAVTAFLIPLSAGCVPTTSGSICYDSTNNKYTFGQNGSTVSFALSSAACAAHQWVSTPATGTATAICTQPASADISDGTGSGVVVRTSSPTIAAPTLTTPTLTTPTSTNAKFNTGIANNGTGFQHMRFTGCSVTGAGFCDLTQNWNTTWTDTNYTVTCNSFANASPSAATMPSINSKSTTQIGLRIVEIIGTTTFSPEVDCIGVHD